jgi:hypothetical protein
MGDGSSEERSGPAAWADSPTDGTGRSERLTRRRSALSRRSGLRFFMVQRKPRSALALLGVGREGSRGGHVAGFDRIPGGEGLGAPDLWIGRRLAAAGDGVRSDGVIPERLVFVFRRARCADRSHWAVEGSVRTADPTGERLFEAIRYELLRRRKRGDRKVVAQRRGPGAVLNVAPMRGMSGESAEV